MRISQLIKVIGCTFLLFSGLVAKADDNILEYDGKKFKVQDLPVAAQQSLFDVEYRSYLTKKQTIEADVLLEMYATDEAKKAGKSVEDVKKDLLKVADSTDKEAQAFFDKNKARIPYPFDKVKDEIKRLVAREKEETKRTEVIDMIKKKKKVKVNIEEPIAPVIKIETADFASKGKVGGKVQIVEFADYQCPHCQHAAQTLKPVLEKYKDQIHFVYIDFPINPSGVSRLVARGSQCAGKQNKFWEFHYMAFDKQQTLGTASSEEFAKALKLDEAKFKECYASKWSEEIVEKGRKEGERIGVSGTPSIFINGRRYSGPHEGPEFIAAIEKELKASS